MQSFKIEVRDHPYQGAWLVEGDTLEVRSDYGRRTVNLSGREPAMTAREVLAAMIPPSRR